MNRGRHIVWALLVAAAVVAADQVSKAVITDNISLGERVDVIGPLQFTLTYNDGVAFGLAGGGGVFVIVLAVIALVALGAFVAAAPQSNGTWVAGGLILGGAAGNLIDRIRIEHVTDFVLLPSFPAFNLADSAITIGVIVLAWTLIMDGRETAEREKQATGGDPGGIDTETGAAETETKQSA